MTDALRQNGALKTIQRSIDDLVADLDDVGVSLEEVIGEGELGFGLKGEALLGYVRRALRALIVAGARPTCQNSWKMSVEYGVGANDMIENVIQAWHALERPLDWGDFRFAKPELAAWYQKEMFERDR